MVVVVGVEMRLPLLLLLFCWAERDGVRGAQDEEGRAPGRNSRLDSMAAAGSGFPLRRNSHAKTCGGIGNFCRVYSGII